MKKITNLILAAVLILGLAACGEKKEETPAVETETTAAQAETAAETAAAQAETVEAGMANPMTEITDSAEFMKELGIDIDSTLLYSDAKLFITDDRLAECQFSFENIMGENVDCTLRATKDETLAENLHGIYDSTLAEVNRLNFTVSGGELEITVSENAAQDVLIYTWKNDDVWYSMVFQGSPSQMEVAEVMDSVMLAAGIETELFAAEENAAEDGETAGWYELSNDETVLTVRLEANATTGYEWSYKIWDEGSLELIEESYIPDAGAAGLVGSGGIWQASFRATGPEKRNNYDSVCRNDVRFTYSRKWEDGAIPSKVLDLNIAGSRLEAVGVHEPDFSASPAEDGEYEVTLDFNNMIEENELSFYALAGIPVIITFTDDEVKNLKIGDVIPLTQYGLYDVEVEQLEKRDDKTIVLSDWDYFSYRDDLGAWVLVGVDGDVYKYNKEYRTVHFTNETEIDDGMEEVAKSGDTGTIYDKMRKYCFADVKINVQDGFVKKIRIYYHP